MTERVRNPDAWDYTRAVLLRTAALLVFAVAAGYQLVRGFVEGVLESRENIPTTSKGETPFPGQPRPAARPRPRPVEQTPYEVLLEDDSEVTVNGIPIGYISSGPWQFCSYTEPPAPARESKMRAFDDACDYAETQARAFHRGRS